MNLENLKAGDKVAVMYGSGAKNRPCRVNRIQVVSKVTKTQVVVGSQRYNRHTGGEVGGTGSVWIQPASAEHEKTYAANVEGDRRRAAELKAYQEREDIQLSNRVLSMNTDEFAKIGVDRLRQLVSWIEESRQ